MHRPEHQPGAIVTLSRERVREVDRIAIEELSIPGIVLMENAAIALEEIALAMLVDAGTPTGHAVILAGPGNNGGDGFALARRLHNRGVSVQIVATAEPDSYRGDAATNLRIIQRMGLPLVSIESIDPTPTLIVDALLGTGATTPPRPPFDELIGWINSTRRAAEHSRVLAVDIPTGLDADTGRPLGDAECVVRADRTVTLAAMKPGLAQPHARQYTGEITVGDIGVPPELLASLAEP